MRVMAAGTGLLIALGASPRDADACSCGNLAASVAPANTETGVPINARVLVRFDYAVQPSVELRDATTNEIVPLAQEVRIPRDSYFGTTVIASPLAPLAPNASYVVVVRHDASAEPKITMTTFTTGDTIDTTPPAFAGLEAIMLETMRWPVPDEDGGVCVSSCISIRDGHISRIRVEYRDPPSDAVHVALQLYRPGDELVDEVPVMWTASRFFGYEICTTMSPTLVPGAEYCARMVAYDVAGNVAGLGSEVCSAAQICEPLGLPDNPVGEFCDPSDECRPPSPPPESSGCASTHSPGWLLVLLALRRRKTKGPGVAQRPAGFP